MNKLNFEQLTAKLRKQEDNVKELNFNQKKKLSVLRKKLAMHQRFIVSLSEKDVPRLKQLISDCKGKKRNDIFYKSYNRQ